MSNSRLYEKGRRIRNENDQIRKKRKITFVPKKDPDENYVNTLAPSLNYQESQLNLNPFLI